MALVVLLRGVNVGGHRTFRPSLLAKALGRFDVVNVGTAGTFVVRKPGSRTAFRAALLAKLPFGALVAMCDGRDLVRLAREHRPDPKTTTPDRVRFVSLLTKASRVRPVLPRSIPATGDWLVRIDAFTGRFVVGEYRRQMRTIACLGQIDTLVGAPVTTRSWSTIAAVVRILEGDASKRGCVAGALTTDSS